MTTTYKRFVPALLTLLLLAATHGVRAEYQKLEAIVAVVDDDVVLASELVARLETVKRSIQEENIQPPPADVLVSQLMERLIIENIQLQEAKRRGVTIDDESLTAAVARFASNNNMTIEEFQQALAEDGASYRQFREDIRTEMTISRLQRSMINRRITISEQDVQALLNSPFYQQMFSDEYRVGHIMITLEDNAADPLTNNMHPRFWVVVLLQNLQNHLLFRLGWSHNRPDPNRGARRNLLRFCFGADRCTHGDLGGGALRCGYAPSLRHGQPDPS